jgi:single-strand DNA-binding protein
MAFALNRVELIGHVGNVPDVRVRSEGDTVARFSVATDRPTKPGTEPGTDWHQVVCFGRLGEFSGQHVGKGRLVFVAGRLSYRAFEARNGETRRRAEVVATDVILLDWRPANPVDPGLPAIDDEDLRG